MNGNGSRHSARTKALIRSTAERLGYHPHRMAQAMRQQRTKVVGVLMHEGMFDASIRSSSHASKALQARGYQPLRVDLNWFGSDSGHQLERLLLSNGVEGLVIIGSDPCVLNIPLAEALSKRVPLTGVNALGGLPLLQAIRADVRGAFSRVTRHLLESGRKRLVMISNGGTPQSDWRDWHWQSSERYLGFAEGLGLDGESITRGDPEGIKKLFAAAGDTPVGAVFCKPNVTTGEDPFEQAAGYIEAMLAVGLVPDAVVCQNDHWAIGVMRVLWDTGIKIPCQVAVSGFDDTLIGLHHPFPLTTFSQPFEKMAMQAVDTLLAVIEDGADTVSTPLRLFECELKLRESTEVTIRAARPKREAPCV